MIDKTVVSAAHFQKSVDGQKFENTVLEMAGAHPAVRKYRPATILENTTEHWDVMFATDTEEYYVDCKAKEPEDVVLLEGRTVCGKTGTHEGWLYSKRMTHIGLKGLDGITWPKLDELRTLLHDFNWDVTPVWHKNGDHTLWTVFTRHSVEGKPWVEENVIFRLKNGDVEAPALTRGDRFVYVPMSLVKELPCTITTKGLPFE